MHPREPRPNELLSLRLQHRSLQIKIIHSSNPEKVHPRKACRDPVHNATADRTEESSHIVASSCGIIAGVAGQLVFATDPLDIFVSDGEVGREHRGGQLMAIGTIAGERVHDAVESLEVLVSSLQH